jgi:hypothetical protein
MFGSFPFAGASFADVGQANISIAVTGVSATTQLGVVKTGISVQPSPVLATASVGTVFAKTSYNAVVTGFGLTTGLGDVDEYLQIFVYPTGVSSTVSLGTVIPSSDNILDVTGFGLTASLGTATVTAGSYVDGTGLSATVSLGTVAVTAEVVVYLTGVSARGGVSTPLVWGIIDTTQTPNWVPIAA